MNFKKLCPEGTFLAAYLDMHRNVETPQAYDFWGGLWVLSSALGREVYVDRPKAPVFLNWYLILVAESGITRKSTAVRSATSLLREVRNDIPIVSNKITPEELEYRLSDLSLDSGKSHIAISSSELVTFLGREGYVKAMPGLLTDLYDCDAVRGGGGTVGRRPTLARNVYVTLIAGCTPNWLLKTVNPDVVAGGFTSRVLFVVADERKALIPWPKEDEDANNARRRAATLLQDCVETARSFPRIRLTDGAMRAFVAWYKRRQTFRDPYRASFVSREDGHVLRLAACLSVNAKRCIIDHFDVRAAIRVIEAVREQGATIFEHTLTDDKLIVGVDKVRTILLAAGRDGISQSRLSRTVQHYINGADLANLLDIMHELELVQQFEIRVALGRPKKLWRATTLLATAGIIEKVIDKFDPSED